MNNTSAYEFIDSYNGFVLNDYENHNHIISSVFKNQDLLEIILSKKKQMIIKREKALKQFRTIQWSIVMSKVYRMCDVDWWFYRKYPMEMYLVNKYIHSNSWVMKQLIKNWRSNTINYITSNESTVQQKTNYVIRNSRIDDSVVEDFIIKTAKGRFYTIDKDTTIDGELYFNNIKFTERRAQTRDGAHSLFRKYVYDYTYDYLNQPHRRGKELDIYRMRIATSRDNYCGNWELFW